MTPHLQPTWSARQKYCLRHMGVTLWQSRAATNADGLCGNANDPALCLIIGQSQPQDMLYGYQLVRDVLSFIGHDEHKLCWFHGDPNQLPAVDCPLLPQTETIAELLCKKGLSPLPPLSRLLSHPLTKKDLQQRLTGPYSHRQ